MKVLPNEGGYYVETYRAKEKIFGVFGGERNFSTAILYLLTPDTFSALHRLSSDEIFHFYFGGPVTMLQLHPDGASDVITLGSDIKSGQHIQAIVPKGSWQGCFLKEGGSFALMGTTMSHGFDVKDYEQGRREGLLKRYPAQSELIIHLIR